MSTNIISVLVFALAVGIPFLKKENTKSFFILLKIVEKMPFLLE
jgi:hypothetical protein